jgi:hypothetical protein
MPILGIGLLAVGTIAVGVYSLAKAQKEKQQQAWSSAAEELGAQFTPEVGEWYQSKTMQLNAQLDNIQVLVDHYTVSHGKSSTTYTRLKALASSPIELHLHIYEEGFFSTLGKAFGTQDVIIGAQAFDDKFIVKASDEEFCRAWMNNDIQTKLLEVSEYSFLLKKYQVVVTKVGIETNPQKLVGAIRAIAAFANGGKRMMEKLQVTAQELRGTLLCEPNAFIVEKTKLDWAYQNFSFVLEFVNDNEATRFQQKGDLMTCLKVRHLGSGSNFYLSKNSMPTQAESLTEISLQDREFGLEYHLRADDPELGNLFNSELTEKLHQLSFAGISSDKDFVTMYFSGFVSDATTLEKASEVLCLLATIPERDPYR